MLKAGQKVRGGGGGGGGYIYVLVSAVLVRQ